MPSQLSASSSSASPSSSSSTLSLFPFFPQLPSLICQWFWYLSLHRSLVLISFYLLWLMMSTEGEMDENKQDPGWSLIVLLLQNSLQMLRNQNIRDEVGPFAALSKTVAPSWLLTRLGWLCWRHKKQWIMFLKLHNYIIFMKKGFLKASPYYHIYICIAACISALRCLSKTKIIVQASAGELMTCICPAAWMESFMYIFMHRLYMISRNVHVLPLSHGQSSAWLGGSPCSTAKNLQ